MRIVITIGYVNPRDVNNVIKNVEKTLLEYKGKYITLIKPEILQPMHFDVHLKTRNYTALRRLLSQLNKGQAKKEAEIISVTLK